MDTLEIFEKICTIPHCSRDTSKMRDFIEEFCLKQGCFVEIDTAGNILARKGYPKICLQAHYDMVCIGKAPKIEVYKEDGFLKAKESSLGADNGIGVAIMLLAASKFDDIELLFTNDEEVGMLGARDIKLTLKSNKILNLDTEEEAKVYIGCAGGVDIKAIKKLERLSLKDEEVYEVSISNLPGGHSGVDIDKDIPNAIKELGFYLGKFYPKIISLSGGEALNSIPKNAKAVIAMDKTDTPPMQEGITVKKINSKENEYIKDSKMLIDMICGFANGIRGYDKKLLIPTKSVNLSKIQIINDNIVIELFPRANDDLSLERIKKEIFSYFSLQDYKVKFSNQFGAWKPEINEFTKEVFKVCKDEFDEVSFAAIHAGLECGVLLEKLGKDKLIASIGPNIYAPHSTDEKCEIDSILRLEKIVEKLIRK